MGAFPMVRFYNNRFNKGRATPGFAIAPVTYHLTMAGDKALPIPTAKQKISKTTK